MKCVICGKEIEKSRYSNKVLCSSECFNVDFWNGCIDKDAIIINGECYHDGGIKPADYRGFLGHSGRVFNIKMNDGRIIKTNNLWYNGVVPPERGIKDNACFIKLEAITDDLFEEDLF